MKLKLCLLFCFLILIGVIIIFNMTDYSQVGFDNNLLRELNFSSMNTGSAQNTGLTSIEADALRNNPAGFTPNLVLVPTPIGGLLGGIQSQEISSYPFQQISGDQVVGDKIVSKSKSMNIDLENDSFTVNEGQIKRIEIGKLPDGKIGMVLRDNLGTALLNITGEEHLIQSANKKTFFNLASNLLQIADDKGTTIIDSTGLISSANFRSDSKIDNTVRNIATGNQSTYTDVSGTSFNTINFTRPTNVLITVGVTFKFTLATYTVHGAHVVLNIDGTDLTDSNLDFYVVDGPIVDAGINPNDPTQWLVYNYSRSSHPSASLLKVFQPGIHSLKLRAATSAISADGDYLVISHTSVNYVVLGT